MRDCKHIIVIFLIIILSLFLWNCSSHKKLLIEIQKDPPSPALEQHISQEALIEEEPPPIEEKKEQSDQEQLPQEADITQKEQDPSELLEEALDAYQDARIAWEKGDFDTSLAALDEAYSLILKLELPQDSSLIQEKNDLRLLIAQRIQEIYGSRLITVGDNHQTIPLVENKYVLAEIKSFQTKEKKDFEEAYKRSGRYKEMINEEMKKAGLPEELSWMPIIESGFKVNAYSRARALGLWQFISSTGYRFGLKRDQWIDERMDPVKATQAAIKYLNELHSLFGDWTTALAAYNCGEFRVQRVIRLQRIEYLDNFWDLYTMLPKETARFVPRLIATFLIINNPEKYGFNLPSPDPPLRYETIKINRPIRLSSLSKKLELGSEALASLNPELRYKATPEHEYLLKIPIGSGEKALAAVNSISRWIPPEATYVYHYVRRGETVSGIAKRYRTSVTAIARLNRLSRNYLIRPGQRLKVPGRGRSYVSARPFQLIKDGEKLVYIVRRGDSLYRIANSFSTTVQRIKKENNLRSDNLSIGQKLVIQSGRPEGATLYTVKTGDTPFEIAKKYRMNLNTLLNLNGLHSRSKIYPGQKLWVTPNDSK